MIPPSRTCIYCGGKKQRIYQLDGWERCVNPECKMYWKNRLNLEDVQEDKE